MTIGAGKTTAAAKLAKWCMKQEYAKKILLVAGLYDLFLFGKYIYFII